MFTVNNILHGTTTMDIDHHHESNLSTNPTPPYPLPLHMAGQPPAVAPLYCREHPLILSAFYQLNQIPYQPYGSLLGAHLHYPFLNSGSPGSAFTPVASHGSLLNGFNAKSDNNSNDISNGNRKSPVIESTNLTNGHINGSPPNNVALASTVPKQEPLSSFGNLHIMVDSNSSTSSPRMNGSHASSYDGSHDSPLSNASRSNSPNSIPLPANSNAKCLVCDDKASGYHYGVVSCEGCKGFFRRTVQKNIQYHCHKDSKCPITQKTRNRCQYCRFKKCLDTGMSKESVRQDRNRKRKHREDDEEAEIRHTSNLQNVIRTILNAQNDTMTTNEFEENHRLVLSLLCHKVDDGLSRIFEFAHRVPGFSELSTTDQTILKHCACLEILAIRCAFINAGQPTAFDAKAVLHVANFAHFVDSVNKLTETFRHFQVLDEEVALLSAICLMYPDRSGLENVTLIENYQNQFLTALRMQIKLRPNDNSQHTQHAFAKLLMKLSDIRSLSLRDGDQMHVYTKPPMAK